MKSVHGKGVYIFGEGVNVFAIAVYIHALAVNRFLALQIRNTMTTNSIQTSIKPA